MERQEQYSRRYCILIQGLKEEKNESTYDRVLKLFRVVLNEDVVLADLDRTHRIGKKGDSSSKPRPLIVKFARYNVREKVYSREKILALKKNLTGYRMSILNDAKGKFGFKNVWTYDGQILYKDNNDGQKIKIYYE